MKMDAFEKELVEDEDLLLERAVTITDTERECLQAAARNTLNKDKRINIRISSRDLNVLRRMANRFGMPYQTLVSSVLHRYVSGDLDDARFERGKADETSA